MKKTTIIKDNDITNYMSKNNKKEYKMSKRLEKKCTKKKMEFAKSLTNSSTIDCFINDNAIQCKFTNNKKNSRNYFPVSCHKRKNGKISPYEKGDFDFLIVELGKHKKNFYIFPIKKLIKKDIVKSKNNAGRKSFTVMPPDYKKKHWTLKYLNRFDLLKPKNIDPEEGVTI